LNISFFVAFPAPVKVCNYPDLGCTKLLDHLNPTLKAMEYRWSNQVRLYQSFEYFIEQKTIRYNELLFSAIQINHNFAIH